jgi:hypothetical protein
MGTHKLTESEIKIFETLRAFWESGRYSTLPALHRKAVELFGDEAPNYRKLYQRAHREMWENDCELKLGQSEEIKKTAASILDDLGMGFVRQMEIITEIVNGPLEDYAVLRNELRNLDPQSLKTVLPGLSKMYTSGLKLALEGIKVIRDTCADPSEKAKSDHDYDGIPLDDKTPEEIQAEIDRTIAALAHRYNETKNSTT